MVCINFTVSAGLHQAHYIQSVWGWEEVLALSFSRGDLASDQTNCFPAVKVIFFGPVAGSSFTLGTPFGPDLFKGVGATPKDPQHGGRIWVTNATIVFPMGYIQGVVGSILGPPALLLEPQPR